MYSRFLVISKILDRIFHFQHEELSTYLKLKKSLFWYSNIVIHALRYYKCRMSI